MVGKPVEGLEGTLKKDLDYTKLKKADVLYFLTQEVIEGKPVTKISGKDYRVRLMGLYIGDRGTNFIYTAPGEKVRERQLSKFPYEALLVTRTSE